MFTFPIFCVNMYVVKIWICRKIFNKLSKNISVYIYFFTIFNNYFV